jgi:hypothetical protein
MKKPNAFRLLPLNPALSLRKCLVRPSATSAPMDPVAPASWTNGASDRRAVAVRWPGTHAHQNGGCGYQSEWIVDSKGRPNHSQDHCRKPRSRALFPPSSSRRDAHRRGTFHPRSRLPLLRSSRSDSHGGDCAHSPPAPTLRTTYPSGPRRLAGRFRLSLPEIFMGLSTPEQRRSPRVRTGIFDFSPEGTAEGG